MSDTKSGGPAFGQVVNLRAVRVEMNGDTEWEPEAISPGGLSVRDYFAAKALQALVAANNYDGQEFAETLSLDAYELADAMMKARRLP